LSKQVKKQAKEIAQLKSQHSSTIKRNHGLKVLAKQNTKKRKKLPMTSFMPPVFVKTAVSSFAVYSSNTSRQAFTKH